MHILFLTQIIPYPPDAGPRVKTWHVLRYLSGLGCRITLVSFIRPEEEGYLKTLREVCTDVHTVPIRRSRPADLGYWLRSQWTGRPFLVERDDSRAMRAQVRSIVEKGDVDAIHADQLTMAQFARTPGLGRKRSAAGGNGRPVAVFDAHNAVWTILRRMAENAPPLLRPLLIREARMVEAYEGRVVRSFDRVLAVTEIDRQALLQAAGQVGGDRISVIPIAVDTVKLRPVEQYTRSNSIVTLGTLHYPPNADGIRWFLHEVFPLVRDAVPEATLTIIGKHPPRDFLQAAEAQPDAVRVTGYVPDLDEYMSAAAVVAIPVRAGGGMRVRILEAFSRGLPVVTTTVGMEGIDALPGRELLTGDTALDFAGSVIRFLEDPDLRVQTGRRARALAEARYDWQVALQDLEAIYKP